ncbi:MAG: hypothetical protein ACI8PZ_005579 [Myxococcota bacterium]|jgi:hypothetical protein
MVTTLLAAVVVAASAATPQDLRDTSGRGIALDAVPTAVVPWTLDCRSCVAEMAELTAQGVRVVAVNLDPAHRRSALTPHLRARGVRALVVADPTGDLWNSIAATAAPDATVAWRGPLAAGVRVATR